MSFPRNPIPTDTPQKAASISQELPCAPQPHHQCPAGKWGAENLLPGHKRLLLVLPLRASLDLGESLHTHMNIHSYTAPPHAARRVLLWHPDHAWLPNLALIVGGEFLEIWPWAILDWPCRAQRLAHLSSDVHLVLHKRGQIPNDPQEKICPRSCTVPHLVWVLSWVQPLISAEWNFCGGEDLERNQWTTSQIKIVAGIIAGHKRENFRV